jgi:flagellar P-ring protein precursor FlgI
MYTNTHESLMRGFVLSIALLGLIPATAFGARIKDLCEVQGARENGVRGFGLVVGLAGTGDKAEAARLAQEEVLNRMQIEVNSIDDIESDNVAVVMVTATMPAFAKEGTRLDAHVQSFYDAESLEGGTLVETILYGPDGETAYALAQGPLSVGGFNADAGGGTSARKNHVTVGRIPMGAYVEREVPSRITDGERIMLLLKRPDFNTAQNISDVLNADFGGNSAVAFGAGTVSVTIPPSERADLVGFIAKVLDASVEADDGAARVVINERTGTIVVGGNVRVRPCQVAHGGLTITVAVTPIVSQPLPFSEGETEIVELADVEVEEIDGRLMPLQGVSAAEVAEGLNRLMVTPRDIIAIFQALREAGVMDADLETM